MLPSLQEAVARHARSWDVANPDNAAVRAGLTKHWDETLWNKGCGIKGFIPTLVIQGNSLFIWGVGLWEALFVVSQKWSFPTALYYGTRVQTGAKWSSIHCI